MRRHVAKFLTRVTEAEPVISLPLALPRRPALDGRSFPNQRNRSAKVGFVDLEGVGLDLEGKISYGHLDSWASVSRSAKGSERLSCQITRIGRIPLAPAVSRGRAIFH